MIFTIGVVALIVGIFIYRRYEFSLGIWETSLGEKVGNVLILAGVVLILLSSLMLAWRYLP